MQKNKKTISLLIIVFSMFFSKTLYSQVNTLYFMENIHQTHYTNPAFQSKCNTFIGLPAISSINANITNSGFSYKNLIHLGTGIYSDSLIIDVNGLKEKLGKNNYTIVDVNTPILGLGFWVKDSYFTFDIANKTMARISYPGNLIRLIDGNGGYIGDDNPLEINDIGPDAISYNEYSFGLSKRITHRLTIGGKFKLISGLANINSKQSDISITTKDVTYDLTLATNLDISSSLPLVTEKDEDGNITGFEEYDSKNIVKDILSFKNFGVGFDFGANYQFNDRIKFYASITDLGFISWKRNTINIKQQEDFTFTGMSLDSMLTGGSSDAMGSITDSLMNFLNLQETSINYSTALPTKIYIGGTFDLTKSINLGLLSKTFFFDRKLHQAVTLSTNLSPVKWFSTTLSYSMMNRSYNNIGLGFSIKTGPVQFYLVTDNINTLILPKSAKSFNLMFGFNIGLGCGKRDDFSTINNKKTLKEIDFM